MESSRGILPDPLAALSRSSAYNTTHSNGIARWGPFEGLLLRLWVRCHVQAQGLATLRNGEAAAMSLKLQENSSPLDSPASDGASKESSLPVEPTTSRSINQMGADHIPLQAPSATELAGDNAQVLIQFHDRGP